MSYSPLRKEAMPAEAADTVGRREQRLETVSPITTLTIITKGGFRDVPIFADPVLDCVVGVKSGPRDQMLRRVAPLAPLMEAYDKHGAERTANRLRKGIAELTGVPEELVGPNLRVDDRHGRTPHALLLFQLGFLARIRMGRVPGGLKTMQATEPLAEPAPLPVAEIPRQSNWPKRARQAANAAVLAGTLGTTGPAMVDLAVQGARGVAEVAGIAQEKAAQGFFAKHPEYAWLQDVSNVVVDGATGQLYGFADNAAKSFVMFAQGPEFESRQPQSPEAYTVGGGETLMTVAVKYGLNPWDIAAANGMATLYTPIYEGQKLYLAKPGQEATIDQPVRYSVGSGENLVDVAVHYGIPPAAIARANDLPLQRLSRSDWEVQRGRNLVVRPIDGKEPGKFVSGEVPQVSEEARRQALDEAYAQFGGWDEAMRVLARYGQYGQPGIEVRADGTVKAYPAALPPDFPPNFPAEGVDGKTTTKTVRSNWELDTRSVTGAYLLAQPGFTVQVEGTKIVSINGKPTAVGMELDRKALYENRVDVIQYREAVKLLQEQNPNWDWQDQALKVSPKGDLVILERSDGRWVQRGVVKDGQAVMLASVGGEAGGAGDGIMARVTSGDLNQALSADEIEEFNDAVRKAATPKAAEATPEIPLVIPRYFWNNDIPEGQVPAGEGYAAQIREMSAFLADEANLEAAGMDKRAYRVFGFLQPTGEHYLFLKVGKENDPENLYFYWNGETLVAMPKLKGTDITFYSGNPQMAVLPYGGQWEYQPMAAMGFVKVPEGAGVPVTRPETRPNVPVLVDMDWNSNSTDVVKIANTPGFYSGYISSAQDPEKTDIRTALLVVRIESVKKSSDGRTIELVVDGGEVSDKHRIAAGRFNVTIVNGDIVIWTQPELPREDKGVRPWPVAPSYETKGNVWLSDQIISELSGRLVEVEPGYTYQDLLNLEQAHARGEMMTVRVRRMNFLGAENPQVTP